MLNTPVLFLVFNRPDTTARVFEVIKQAQPAQLFIAADGARPGKEGEAQLCKEVRDLVLNGINWNCEVKTLLREENLGCGKAVSGAISWFFEHVEEGIILEDDCLPDISFFQYCEVLLKRYKNENDIFHIGGNNFQFGKRVGDGDYYFSTLGFIWGWATWRRAWELYEFDLSKAAEIEELKYQRAFGNQIQFIEYYSSIFKMMKNDSIDTWDYQWLYAIILNKALAICPERNLVENIGFGSQATHTKEKTEWNEKNNSFHLASFNPPSNKGINYDADTFVLKEIFEIGLNKDKLLGKNKISNYSIINKIRKSNMLNKLLRKLRTQPKNEIKWEKIEYFDEIWKNRIELMSKYVEPNSSVLDLGCGKMWLKQYLKSTNTYYGVDYISRAEDTIVCDFNKYQFPDKTVDCIFISGCLEYINDVEWFVKSSTSHSNYIVLSYCLSDNFPDIEVRKNNAWVNHLNYENIIDVFKTNNFELFHETITETKNTIFFFKKLRK